MVICSSTVNNTVYWHGVYEVLVHAPDVFEPALVYRAVVKYRKPITLDEISH